MPQCTMVQWIIDHMCNEQAKAVGVTRDIGVVDALALVTQVVHRALDAQVAADRQRKSNPLVLERLVWSSRRAKRMPATVASTTDRSRTPGLPNEV